MIRETILKNILKAINKILESILKLMGWLVMDSNQNIGKIRYMVTQFDIIDGEISRIIKDTLSQKGYEIEILPIIQHGTNFPMGETIKVFRIETIPV